MRPAPGGARRDARDQSFLWDRRHHVVPGPRAASLPCPIRWTPGSVRVGPGPVARRPPFAASHRTRHGVGADPRGRTPRRLGSGPAQPAHEGHRPAGVSMIVDVTQVEVLKPYRLRLEFDDGTAGEVDISELVPFEGVFAPLRDPVAFGQVRV